MKVEHIWKCLPWHFQRLQAPAISGCALKGISILIVVLLWPLLHVVPASGQALSPDRERVAQDIFEGVLSPFCPGRSLNDCPSAQASELKAEIRTSLSQGASADSIIDSLYQRFGEEIRAVPKGEGFGLLVWIAPIIFLLLGGVIILIWMAKKHKLPTTDTAPAAPLNPEMEERIARELARKVE